MTTKVVVEDSSAYSCHAWIQYQAVSAEVGGLIFRIVGQWRPTKEKILFDVYVFVKAT